MAPGCAAFRILSSSPDRQAMPANDHRIDHLVHQVMSLHRSVETRPWLLSCIANGNEAELRQALAADDGLEELLGVFKTPVVPPGGRRDEVWIGEHYERERILVLGESWYGDYGEDRNTDRGYVRAYVNGQQADGMYTKMAQACGLSREEYWQAIAFTNFAQWVGEFRTDRPTRMAYEAAVPRLQTLLSTLKPKGVWILGKGQGTYSGPVVHAAGIPFVVTKHPTSVGLTSAELGASWHQLRQEMRE